MTLSLFGFCEANLAAPSLDSEETDNIDLLKDELMFLDQKYIGNHFGI